MFRNYSECYSYRRYVQKSPFTVQVLQGRLGARYGSRWSCRRGKAAWRGRGHPAPRQGGRGERPGELAVGHCNERARPVCLFISWWISGPTYSLPHTSNTRSREYIRYILSILFNVSHQLKSTLQESSVNILVFPFFYFFLICGDQLSTPPRVPGIGMPQPLLVCTWSNACTR